MTTQPEALRLAGVLAAIDILSSIEGMPELDVVSAELRRLHEVNQELLEALIRMVCNFNIGDMNDGEYKALQHARATIAKATGKQA